jgi:hypothetical protein
MRSKKKEPKKKAPSSHKIASAVKPDGQPYSTSGRDVDPQRRSDYKPQMEARNMIRK